jgi:ElaB/YqjD/DUF883 family membrane-anchored ribosome-binding protein
MSDRPPANAVGPVSTGTEPRTAEQIRSDIQSQREQLGTSVEALRTRVNELTDWRRQVEEHRQQLITGAAVVGFLIGARAMLKRRRR